MCQDQIKLLRLKLIIPSGHQKFMYIDVCSPTTSILKKEQNLSLNLEVCIDL